MFPLKVDTFHSTSPAINNIIWRLLTGKRTRQTDPELVHLTDCIADLAKAFDVNLVSLLESGSYAAYHFLKYFLANNWTANAQIDSPKGFWELRSPPTSPSPWRA